MSGQVIQASRMNLIFASGAVLFAHVGLLIGTRWAGSPPNTAPAYRLVEALPAIGWFLSAAALHFGKDRSSAIRLSAWVISVACAGAVAFFFFAVLVSTISELWHPLPDSPADSNVASIAAWIVVPASIAVALVLSLRLVLGLLRMRKAVVAGAVAQDAS